MGDLGDIPWLTCLFIMWGSFSDSSHISPINICAPHSAVTLQTGHQILFLCVCSHIFIFSNWHNSYKTVLLTFKKKKIFQEAFLVPSKQHLPMCVHSALSAQEQLCTGRAWNHIGLQPYLQSQAQSLEWAKESRQHQSIMFLDRLLIIRVLTSLLTFPL